MGKGAGACLGKESPPAPQPQPAPVKPAPATQIAAKATNMAEPIKIYVLFYSTYGHVHKLAEREAAGGHRGLTLIAGSGVQPLCCLDPLFMRKCGPATYSILMKQHRRP